MGWLPSILKELTQLSNSWGLRLTVGLLPCTQLIGVQFPEAPLAGKFLQDHRNHELVTQLPLKKGLDHGREV